MCVYVCILRERERERSMYIYIYIHVQHEPTEVPMRPSLGASKGCFDLMGRGLQYGVYLLCWSTSNYSLWDHRLLPYGS